MNPATLNKGILWVPLLIFVAVCSQDGRAQSVPANGLYQIVSGTYNACCGIAGDIGYALPAQSQAFVNLTIHPETDLATITFLGQDEQTVFQAVPCPPASPIHFSFDYGFVYSNQIFFHVDPGPPPDQKFWSYTVSNFTNTLTIDGQVGVSQGSCADVPNRFGHSNVVAVWVTNGPLVIDQVEHDGDSFRFHFSGEPPYDYTVEYSDSLAKTNWTPLTTYRAKLQTIDITVTNSFTKVLGRFFRVLKQPCNCR